MEGAGAAVLRPGRCVAVIIRREVRQMAVNGQQEGVLGHFTDPRAECGQQEACRQLPDDAHES